MTDHVIGERLRKQVSDLLDACAETTTESHRGGYGSSLIRAPYPPVLHPEPIPGLRPGRLCVHRPDGTRWAPDRLLEVLGRPVQHPVEDAVFAGVAIDSGGPRCWIADATTRSVTFLTAPAPALLVGDDTPLAWAGSSLVVPVDPPPGPYDAAPRIFESTPGQRVRVTTGAPAPDRRPSRFIAVDPAGGTIRAMHLDARPYERVRGAATGHIAAYAAGAGARSGLVVVGAPGAGHEHLIRIEDGPLHEFCWPATARAHPAAASPAAHLVMVTGRPDGFDVTACPVSEDAAEPARPLHRHRGRYLHSHCQETLAVLALEADGSYTVLIVDPGAPRPVISLTLGLRPPTLVRIAAVAAGSRFATVDAENNVTVWDVPADGTAARRLADLSLPEDEELITLAGWEPGEVRPVCGGRRARSPLPAHPGGPPPLRGTVPAAATDCSLYLPAQRDPAAVLVWLSQAGETPADSAPSALDPHWLTLAGFGVLDMRITPGWSPDVPDEEIRPRLVRQIRDAVLGSGAHRHVDPSRLAVGGGSFGATLALLAVADCDLFGTAIVQSGAYSRQLTLLGFQDESRSRWEAPRVYDDFDAIVGASRIRRPVLIIHGEADRNPATPVIQATLLFQALIANGTRARLVVLPGEGHVFGSRDGIAAAIAEKAAWLAAVSR
jgi:dienelactone hydrolase